MKRCPECDFIYEDDERLCAMDGTGLVNYSGPLPFAEIALPQSVAPTNSSGRSLTLLAAGVILAIAVSLYFHNVTKRNALQSNLPRAAKTYDLSQPVDQKPLVAIPFAPATPFITSSPVLNSTPAKTEAAPKIYPARRSEDNDPFRSVPFSTATPLPRPSPFFSPTHVKTDTPSGNSVFLTPKPTIPNSEPRTAAPGEKQTKTSDTNQKNESKITSFLKKTGRALKKPFKH